MTLGKDAACTQVVVLFSYKSISLLRFHPHSVIVQKWKARREDEVLKLYVLNCVSLHSKIEVRKTDKNGGRESGVGNFVWLSLRFIRCKCE